MVARIRVGRADALTPRMRESARPSRRDCQRVPGRSPLLAARMSDDEPANCLDGFVTRGAGQPLKGGGSGWYDPDRGIAIIQCLIQGACPALCAGTSQVV